MRVLSKKHKPIKAYRKYGKPVIIVFYIVGIVFFPLAIINEIYVYALLLAPFYVWMCWFFNATFEVYRDRFAVAYGFVLLPCKVIMREIFFDTIDWTTGTVGYRGPYEIYTMIINYKNGATKKCEFQGSGRDFSDVVYNWKEIANYENKQ